MTPREMRRDLLWDLLVVSPDGITVYDMMHVYGWTRVATTEAIHDLRILLGDIDTVNLTCDPQGRGEPWIYRLVGTLDEMRPWIANRVLDTRTRLRTMAAMLRSLVAASDGRTLDGRMARHMERTVRHLVETLDDMGP